MASAREVRPARIRRVSEKGCIILSLILGIIILHTVMLHPGPPAAAAPESPQVIAQANAVYNNGWAPLTVYFSGYGSRSQGAEIVRYEWDLDGNGAIDIDATASKGYVQYLYSKPGRYAVTLRVTDSLGRYATDQATVHVRHPASSTVDYAAVFDDSRVRRIDIALRQSDWDAMWADPEAKLQVRADANVFGEAVRDVGFRMRGQFSLRTSGLKKPWEIDTDAFVDGQEYRNLRQLMLLNNIGDSTLLKEKLAYEMMYAAGLPASHTAFVELWIDIADDGRPPVYWGIYSLVERVDNKYIRNRFGAQSQGGNLYKASHAQRGPMDLVYYGDRIEDYPVRNGQYAYGKTSNEEEADYSDIVELCRVIDGTAYESEEDFRRALEGVVNMDAFLRYLAVVTLLDNWDSYPYTGNNYFLYHDPVTDLFEWIPWDLAWGGNPRMPLFERSDPGLVERAPLYDRAMQIGRYRAKYAAYLDLLLVVWFTRAKVAERVQFLHRQIAPFISQSTGDKAFFAEDALFPPEAFDHSWEALLEFVAEREAYARSQLVLEAESGTTAAAEKS
ncbi:MAG: CotH kinase family protein [Anaerolineales bacterium]|nr:CotH kinase family protein [Anaerolineales bacterium]